MSRFVFEAATEAHDADLRRLFAQNEMEGEIGISFRREPSYFYASQVQGSFYQVTAARDTRTGEVVGVATRAVRPGFLNGEVQAVGYLADMRLEAGYRGGLLVGRAYRHLARLHEDGRTRLYFTVIAEGNRRALATIAAGRAGLPPYRDLGRLLSPAVNLLRRKPPLEAGVEIVRGSEALLPEIVACLNRNHARRQFAPYYGVGVLGCWGVGEPMATPQHLNTSTPHPSLRGFRTEDFYVALRDGRVIGVVGKWDQSAYKQTVVTGYRGRLRVARPFLNAAAALMGCARYPAPGEALRSFYAAFIAVDEDDVEVFRALLRRLYNDHVGSGYAYFLVGLHEQDPLAAALSDFSLTPFAGRLFAVHFADGEETFHNLDGRVPYVELAML
jgi:hypothetical protein